MKITNVELFVLKSEGLYNNPEGSEEPLGPTYMGLVKVSTDEGISGYSDMETSASVAKACVEAPKWSEEPGMECFDGLASLLIGENPLEVERLWYRMYRGSIYYGRRGVALQAISAIDIACGISAVKRIDSPCISCWAVSGATRSALTEALCFVRHRTLFVKQSSITLRQVSQLSNSAGAFSARTSIAM